MLRHCPAVRVEQVASGKFRLRVWRGPSCSNGHRRLVPKRLGDGVCTDAACSYAYTRRELELRNHPHHLVRPVIDDNTLIVHNHVVVVLILGDRIIGIAVRQR